MQNYDSLRDTNDQDEEGGVLFHVAEPSRARWNHINDLDSFFNRMYRYHQKHGYMCMVLQEILELNQFIFIVTLTTYLAYGINYPVLFGDKPPDDVDPISLLNHKISLADAAFPLRVFLERIQAFAWFILAIAAVIWVLKLVKCIYHLISFWDIKQFYNTALKIEDSQLENLTWHEVQTRVRTVQLEQQMCIHKRDLTDLDIYHRILRQQNYLIAMVNKRLLPPRITVPYVGEIVYWTSGLAFNMKLLLFWTPWSPFENPWHLREEYRRSNLRIEVANQLRNRIFWLALINLAFSPIILLWQILYAFFSYCDIIRREPGSLALRHWSLYGRLYLRHFNELEHELQARLSRAHRPASKYLAIFSSPLCAIVGTYIGFIAGSILAVLFILTIYDEDVLNVQHILSIMTLLGGTVAVCRSLIPDETVPWCPETLLTNVLAHTHYLPHDWKGQAHTTRVRMEFQQLFQYRVVSLIEELLSPILTPFFLLCYIKPRAIDIVDFFRHFTVSVVGVGDVCSFAQMDIKRHGNSEWQRTNTTPQPAEEPDQYNQAEDGKVELSLMHFTHTNPGWKPPQEAQPFVERVQMESSVAASRNTGELMFHGNLDSSLPYISRLDTPAVHAAEPHQSTYISGIWRNEGPNLSVARDMTLSAVYLHDLHFRQTGGRVRRQPEERTPLLSSN